MSDTIHWDTIIAAAQAGATLLPPPLNIVANLALVIAAGYVADGCNLEGCPADVESDLDMARTPIPTGEGIIAARMRAVARVRGLVPGASRR